MNILVWLFGSVNFHKEGPVNQEQEQSKTSVQEKEVMDKRSKELCRGDDYFHGMTRFGQDRKSLVKVL